MPPVWIGHTLTKAVKLPFWRLHCTRFSLWNCYVALMACTVLHTIPLWNIILPLWLSLCITRVESTATWVRLIKQKIIVMPLWLLYTVHNHVSGVDGGQNQTETKELCAKSRSGQGTLQKVLEQPVTSQVDDLKLGELHIMCHNLVWPLKQIQFQHKFVPCVNKIFQYNIFPSGQNHEINLC